MQACARAKRLDFLTKPAVVRALQGHKKCYEICPIQECLGSQLESKKLNNLSQIPEASCIFLIVILYNLCNVSNYEYRSMDRS